MAYVLEKHYQLPRSALLSRDELELNEIALEDWKKLESKRLQGEPIAYLIGRRGFHNIELYVAPGVLIPRPETELLVEIGLQEIKRLNAPVSILDLGTGSGAIALAIASAFQDKPIAHNLAAFGEISLAGEVRKVSNGKLRENEASRLGFVRTVDSGVQSVKAALALALNW